jgi:hypothetical protein
MTTSKPRIGLDLPNPGDVQFDVLLTGVEVRERK